MPPYDEGLLLPSTVCTRFNTYPLVLQGLLLSDEVLPDQEHMAQQFYASRRSYPEIGLRVLSISMKCFVGA